ncbi:MAG TPA: RcpC/CpaB family pilus assembly protein [Acidimicrobiales bacterium]
MKRQTLILVVIGLVLFIAGGAIAFATVESGTKGSGTPLTAAPVNTPVVVATANLPAGTTGQNLVATGRVAVQLIPQKKYATTDLPNLQGLTDQVLTTAVKKGDAIQSTELTASATSISLPKGMDGVTVTAAGVAGLAGYLQPGSNVDVYANITKVSVGGSTASSAGLNNLPLPCTELLMSNVEVLDVSDTVPALGNHPAAGGRTIPPSLTLLLAVNPTQTRLITFMTLNESLYVAQTQNGATPVPVGTCIGTGQTTTAP